MPICEFGSPTPRFASPVPPSSEHFAGALPPLGQLCRLRAPPLALSRLAHPPLSALCHVGLGGCSALGYSSSSPLSLRSLFSSSGCCCYCFSSSWETRVAGGGSLALSRTCRVNSLLRTLPPRLRETLQELSHLQPPFAWQFCIASHGSGKRKKNVQTAWMLG